MKRIKGVVFTLATVVAILFAPQLVHATEIADSYLSIEASANKLTSADLEMLTNEELANLLIPFEEARSNADRPEIMLITDGLYGDEWRTNAIEIILGGMEYLLDSIAVHVAMLELQDKVLTLGAALWDAYIQGLIDPQDAVELNQEINRLASVDFEEALADGSVSNRQSFHRVGVIESLYAAFNDTDLDNFFSEVASELLVELEDSNLVITPFVSTFELNRALTQTISVIPGQFRMNITAAILFSFDGMQNRPVRFVRVIASGNSRITATPAGSTWHQTSADTVNVGQVLVQVTTHGTHRTANTTSSTTFFTVFHLPQW